MKEIWVDIHSRGHDTYYEVSNHGRIRNKNSGLILNLRYNNKGYKIVDIYINKVKYTELVHRIVAEAFVDNLNNHPIVNHIDGVKSNCRDDNLEWETYSYNNQHAYDLKLKKRPLSGDESYMSKYKEIDIRRVCELLEDNMFFKDISKITGVSIPAIREVKLRHSWVDVSKEYNIPEPRKSTKRNIDMNLLYDLFEKEYSFKKICVLLDIPYNKKNARYLSYHKNKEAGSTTIEREDDLDVDLEDIYFLPDIQLIFH